MENYTTPLQSIQMQHEKAISAINKQIMETSTRILTAYPELHPYLNEMPVCIPDERNPELTLQQLTAYNDALNVLLEKYIAEMQVRYAAGQI